MHDLIRLVRLWRGALPWLLGAMLISLVTTLANVALMATAGWFVTAMAVAGLAGTSMNYFTPSSIIRAAAIIRTGGRWGDRVVSHEATFRLLAATRTALFQRLEAIAPGGLDDLRSGDVAARLKLDVDRLELVFLRFVSPIVIAVARRRHRRCGGGVVAATACWPAAIAALFVVRRPWASVRCWRAPRAARRNGRPTRPANSRRRTVEHLDGLATLLVTGDDRRRIDRLGRLLDQRIDAERRVVKWNTLRPGRARRGIRHGRHRRSRLWRRGSWPRGGSRGPELTLTAAAACCRPSRPSPRSPSRRLGCGATLSSLRRLFALWDRAATVTETTAAGAAARAPMISSPMACRSAIRDAATRRARRACDFELPQGAERRARTVPAAAGSRR